MIYLVTENIDLKKQIKGLVDSPIHLCDVETSIKALNTLEWIGFDTETLGFDPYTKDLLTIQLGNYTHQFVVDVTTVDIQLYKELLELPRKI